MQPDRFSASYLIETPLEPSHVAEVMAGEQSCGTFARVHGETDELRERARATVESIEEMDAVDRPSLSNALLERKAAQGPWRRARVTLSFPVANVGANLPTLASTVSGNLYDLGELTGLRLESMQLPASYRAQFDLPRMGVDGTRRVTGATRGALVGTIIKPNVGLSARQTASLVAQLCDAGVDFIKDDEVCANPVHAPLAERVSAVMAVVPGLPEPVAAGRCRSHARARAARQVRAGRRRSRGVGPRLPGATDGRTGPTRHVLWLRGTGPTPVAGGRFGRE